MNNHNIVRVYHERQIAGLCGVHCLNTLVQGSRFSEVELAEIAARLDEQEKQAMAFAGTDTEAYLSFLSESSGNVGEDGNYSVQVLQEALKLLRLHCFALGSEDARVPRPGITPAYICNLLSHWFTVRRVGRTWVNLNSLLDRPQRLSDSYLELFLQTLQSRGYSIFLVVPFDGHPWPQPPIDSSRGDWHALDLSLPAQNEPAIPSEKEQLDMALAESLSAVDAAGAQQRPAHDEDDDLSRALYLSMVEPQGAQEPNAPPLCAAEEGDQELAQAMQLSMQSPGVNHTTHSSSSSSSSSPSSSSFSSSFSSSTNPSAEHIDLTVDHRNVAQHTAIQQHELVDLTIDDDDEELRAALSLSLMN